MNELQRLAIEIANKTLKIAELETENERLNAEISTLKSKNEDKNTEK
nr:MAG TPA: B-ZIP transcription factor [Caudoviricetes sp.]